MGGFLFGDVAWSPFAGHGGSWRDGAAAGGFPRAGRAVWWRSFGCPGGLVGEGDDGGGGAGDRVLRAGVAERAGRLGLAGTVPVPAGDGAVFRDLAGQRLVAGPSGADCGEDEAAGAGQGQVAAADGLPGAASLLRGSGGEGGVAGDAA